jgi:hypothetical protein
LITRVSDRLRCSLLQQKKNKFAKRKTNVKKHPKRKTETPDYKPIQTQTGSRKPPEKINF